MSEAYGRSSEWASESEPPADLFFAVAKTKPLTPRQLAASLQVAVRSPDQWPALDQSDEWLRHRTELENQANGWVREFEQPTENFQIAVDEALFFSNNDRIQSDLLRDSTDRRPGYLKKIDDQQKVIEQLWLTVLNRSPWIEDVESANAWLDQNPEKKDESRDQLMWALLAGPEFRFNH